MTDFVITDDLARASAAMTELLDRIARDQWDAPTPCTEWTVRDVVGHLVGANLGFVAMIEGDPPPDRDADHLGDDPAEAWRRAAAALQEVVTRPGTLDKTQESPLGVTTARERMRWRIADLLTHAWDLGQATGIAPNLPDELVEQALEFARQQLPNQSRGGRFGRPQPIDDDAPALDRLAAFTGRRVPWTRPAP
ncbi:TIGR03086 family metal-binding protein [Labedaea rhizosphaerae]|uniref:Uncharacterized protein (TIGR03086 family) n=1 Tax=Labedaea rhizosphaerae TaxID=598644 RepID=A0A4R6SGF5_LABRH|nr:TIGR03086 family metal-binding protein [Labedaea rhizosphaerae]TDQ00805.1 uncharacterized protein (TIGR03086 family) [Labedaea rhizosphaerae]